MTYKIEFNALTGILSVGFGTPAQNDVIVRDASARLEAMKTSGELPAGVPVIRVNGPASLPVACVLAHAIGHHCGAVAVFDPKMAKYVVAIAHGGEYQIGELID